LKIDRYLLRGVSQALNCLSINATYCVIVAGASPGETKSWAAVLETIFCTCGSNNWETDTAIVTMADYTKVKVKVCTLAIVPLT